MASSRPFVSLAAYLARQRESILRAWRESVDADPELTTASTVTRLQFNDHIPAVLDAFERELCLADPAANAEARAAEKQGAAEHGLHRWQQGYDQRETMREWGHLHLCLLDVIEGFERLHPELEADVMPKARRALVRLCNSAVCESAARYTWLQRTEAGSRMRELEQAIAQLTALEKQRAEAWREAAHDLRGGVGVVSSAAAILYRDDIPAPARSQFSHVLRKSVLSLHDLLSDLMNLARLEAGKETRNVAPFDAAQLIRELCDAMRPMAAERGLFLRCEGVESLPVEGDAAKVRRIAQNLVLNALHVTERGGVILSWKADNARHMERWMLCVQDTGPGFTASSAPPVSRALEKATHEAHEVEERAEMAGDRSADTEPPPTLDSQSPPHASPESPGEGIGLYIVKRLCELLDASLELESAAGKGSTFRILMPRRYSN